MHSIRNQFHNRMNVGSRQIKMDVGSGQFTISWNSAIELYFMRGVAHFSFWSHTLCEWPHEMVASLELGRVHASDIAHGHRLVECIASEAKQEVAMETGPDWWERKGDRGGQYGGGYAYKDGRIKVRERESGKLRGYKSKKQRVWEKERANRSIEARLLRKQFQ